MATSKSKSKKSVQKKDQAHVIPPSKVAKGRRPHTEASEGEPYQTSLLSSSELESPLAIHKESTLETPHSLDSQEIQEKASPMRDSISEDVAAAVSSAKIKKEALLEGQPAPKAGRTKVDLKDHLESVKGVVQMGTALVKNSFPKPFEIAEKVVENWKEDGDFSELPIEQPLVQFYLGLGLRKAKQTEKELESKLEHAGVLPIFRQQWQKAQKLFNK